MNEFEEEMCFMVSLYGIELDPADIVPLIGDVDQFLGAAGLPASHVSVSARGFGKKPLLFDKAWKRLQKSTPGAVQSASVFSFIEGWESSLRDWTATCDIFPELACFQLGASLVSMPDAEQQVIAFIRDSRSRIRPAYGIGFFRERGRGPACYGIGLGYGRHFPLSSDPGYEERKLICRWSDGMRDAVWNDGLLRDVYPYNLLGARQLERDIDGRSLRDWIRADESRGTLGECPDGCALWTVPGEQLDALRRELAPTGALFVRQP